MPVLATLDAWTGWLGYSHQQARDDDENRELHGIIQGIIIFIILVISVLVVCRAHVGATDV
jgi:hypothetical protein